MESVAKVTCRPTKPQKMGMGRLLPSLNNSVYWEVWTLLEITENLNLTIQQKDYHHHVWCTFTAEKWNAEALQLLSPWQEAGYTATGVTRHFLSLFGDGQPPGFSSCRRCPFMTWPFIGSELLQSVSGRTLRTVSWKLSIWGGHRPVRAWQLWQSKL